MPDVDELRALREAVALGRAAREAMRASRELAEFQPRFAGVDALGFSIGGAQFLVHAVRKRRQSHRTRRAFSAFLRVLEQPRFSGIDTSRLSRRAAGAPAAISGRDSNVSRARLRLGLLQRDVSKVLVELRKLQADRTGRSA